MQLEVSALQGDASVQKGSHMGRGKTEFFSCSEDGESSERVGRGAAGSWFLRRFHLLQINTNE